MLLERRSCWERILELSIWLYGTHPLTGRKGQLVTKGESALQRSFISASFLLSVKVSKKVSPRLSSWDK